MHTPMPRIAVSSAMSSASSSADQRHVDNRLPEMARQIAQIVDLACRQATPAAFRRRWPATRGHRRQVPAEARPDAVGCPHRDLLADDRARQRREGIATRTQNTAGVTLDRPAPSPRRRREFGAGAPPIVGNRFLRKIHPSLHSACALPVNRPYHMHLSLNARRPE